MDGFKQRIIGALIIVCLAVIFLPMLFDEPHQERDRQTLDIPPEPEIPEVRVEAPSEPADPEPPEKRVPRPQAAREDRPDGIGELPMADTHKPEPSPEPGPDTRVLEGAYLVQLGSFSRESNARQLRDRVRDRNMEAYMEPFERNGETLTRVFAGPFVEKEAARKVKVRLDEAFGLDALVISGGD